VKVEGVRELIDLGDPSTWSEPVRLVANDIASQVRGWREDLNDFRSCDLATYDFKLSQEFECRFRQAISSSRILAYHATRLLPHEVDSIRNLGLEPLSHGLVERKLAAAFEHYRNLTSKADIEILRKSGPLTWRGTQGRLGSLFMVAPFAIFESGTSGFHWLFRGWGGEAIGWTNDRKKACRPAAEIIDRLSKVSKPCIIELSIHPQDVASRKELWPTVVGGLLGLADPWTEWSVTIPVHNQHVLEIIQPSSGRWPARQDYLRDASE